jgi:hypothetical protein
MVKMAKTDVTVRMDAMVSMVLMVSLQLQSELEVNLLKFVKVKQVLFSLQV